MGMNTTSKPNYKKTLRACYLGFITQAIAANFAPLIFLKLHNDYQIPLGLIALIPTAFFLTQLVVDIFCARFVDKIGYRVSIVTSEVFSAVGLIALAFLPELLPSAFVGIMISVVLYAIGSGLIEVLCSPIVEACPFENKEKTMSLLHSFYCWGWLGVTIISSVLFTVFGVLAVFREAHRQAVQDVAGGIFELLEVHSVIHADAFARAKPDETVAVLEDGADGIVGQAVIGAEILEIYRKILGDGGQEKRYEEGQKS